jgi:hypothetical protein
VPEPWALGCSWFLASRESAAQSRCITLQIRWQIYLQPALGCKIVAAALPLRGWRVAPPPIRSPSPLSTTIKSAFPLPLSTVALPGLSASHSFCRCEILPPCPFRPKVLLSPFAAPPQPLTRCANHLFSDNLINDLGPSFILPWSTSLWWPPVLIRSLLDHTFLVGGKALRVRSMIYQVISVAGAADSLEVMCKAV